MADANSIANEVRAAIETGELRPGDSVPTAPELADAHRVNVNTAKQAHRILAEAGYIHTKKGRPAIVANRSPLYVITRDAYRKADTDGARRTAWELQVAEIGEEGRTVHYQGRRVDEHDLGLDSRGESLHELLELDHTTDFIHLAGDGYSTPQGPTGNPARSLERVVQIYDGWFIGWLAQSAPELLEPRDDSQRWEGGAFGLIARATGARPLPVRNIITERPATWDETVRVPDWPPMTRISVDVEVSVDVATGNPLCVIAYRRLWGVAQWDLRHDR